MGIFVALSAILLFLTRPLIEKFVTKHEPQVVTNAFSIIGKEGKVTKAIDPVTKIGQIKVGTETWTAKEENDTILNEGEIVKVKAIDGVKAIVSKI